VFVDNQSTSSIATLSIFGNMQWTLTTRPLSIEFMMKTLANFFEVVLRSNVIKETYRLDLVLHVY